MNQPSSLEKEQFIHSRKKKPCRKKKKKTVNITKNGQVMKTINVRRKSKYFTGKNRLMF